MQKLLPLITFQEINKPSFWDYNNFSTVLNAHLREFGNYLNIHYFFGNSEKGFSCPYYMDASEYSNYINDFEQKQKFKNYILWKYNHFALDILLAKYKGIDNRIENIELSESESGNSKKGIYPNPTQLDLVVKDRLREIKPDFTVDDLNDKALQLLKCENNVDAFFTFHFKKYEGEDPDDFANHTIEITNEIWSDRKTANIDRKKYFNEWIERKINEGYLDRSKLNLEQSIAPNPQAEEGEKKQPRAKVIMAFIYKIDDRAKMIPKDCINNDMKFATLSVKIKETFGYEYTGGTLEKEQYTLEGYSLEVYNLLTEWKYNTEAVKYKNEHNL